MTFTFFEQPFTFHCEEIEIESVCMWLAFLDDLVVFKSTMVYKSVVMNCGGNQKLCATLVAGGQFR